MGFWRFAAMGLRGIFLTGTRFTRCLIAGGALAIAAMLGGCAGPRPFSVEEKLWFNKATGIYQPPVPLVFTPHGPHLFDPEPDPSPRYR